jgi:hypothetical protein
MCTIGYAPVCVVSSASRSVDWVGPILNIIAGHATGPLCCELETYVSVFLKTKAIHAILVIFNLLVVSAGVMFVATLLYERYGRATTKRGSRPVAK